MNRCDLFFTNQFQGWNQRKTMNIIRVFWAENLKNSLFELVFDKIFMAKNPSNKWRKMNVFCNFHCIYVIYNNCNNFPGKFYKNINVMYVKEVGTYNIGKIITHRNMISFFGAKKFLLTFIVCVCVRIKTFLLFITSRLKSFNDRTFLDPKSQFLYFHFTFIPNIFLQFKLSLMRNNCNFYIINCLLFNSNFIVFTFRL